MIGTPMTQDYLATAKSILTLTVLDLNERFPHIAWTIDFPTNERITVKILGVPPVPLTPFEVLLVPSISERIIRLYCSGLPFGPLRCDIDIDTAAPHEAFGDILADYLARAQDTLITQRAALAALKTPTHTGIGTSITVTHRNGKTERISDVEAAETSDGSHTIGELYDHRYWLFLALGKCHAFSSDRVCDTPNPAWISKAHADGSMYPGYFIAGITHGDNKHLTYHIPLELCAKVSVAGAEDVGFTPLTLSLWDAAIDAGFSPIDKAPPWDGRRDALDQLWEMAQRPKQKYRAVWYAGSHWQLLDENGDDISTASRSCTPDEAENHFQRAFPAAEIEVDTSDWDEYQRDYCQD